MNKISLRLPYLMTDYALSGVNWLLLWYLRKGFFLSGSDKQMDTEILLKSATIGLGWMLLYHAFGLYREPYRGSRVKELGTLLECTVLGVLAVAFVSFVNDPFKEFSQIQEIILYYLLLQFGLVGAVRFGLSTLIRNLMSKGRLRTNTLVVGCGPRTTQLMEELHRYPLGRSYRVLGCVQAYEGEQHTSNLPLVGRLEGLPQLITQYRAQVVLVALEPGDHARFWHINKALHSAPVTVAAVPEMYDYLLGKVHLRSDLVYSLVEIDPNFLKPFQAFQKRVLDVVASVVALLLLAPVYLALAIAVKAGSRGPIFYSQERIGRNGKPFRIFKFRSMYVDAEKMGPALSQDNDPRITPVGRFLRKSRLDELPQFWNVLLGNMSLVGPRPERQHWIDLIVQQAPEYLQLLKVKPGITSLGQVRYGYASNVGEMVQRMRYDLLYLENMSISWDIRIVLYTVQIVLQGRGK